MNRRTLFATLIAPLLAPFVVKPRHDLMACDIAIGSPSKSYLCTHYFYQGKIYRTDTVLCDYDTATWNHQCLTNTPATNT